MSEAKPHALLRPQIALPFVLVALIWGSTWYVITGQIAAVPPSWSIVYRFGLAFPAMFVVALATIEYLGLFWSHVATAGWLDANDINSVLKATNGLVFLADLLGRARPLAMAALLAVRLALGVLVARRISMERLPAKPAD